EPHHLEPEWQLRYAEHRQREGWDSEIRPANHEDRVAGRVKTHRGGAGRREGDAAIDATREALVRLPRASAGANPAVILIERHRFRGLQTLERRCAEPCRVALAIDVEGPTAFPVVGAPRPRS